MPRYNAEVAVGLRLAVEAESYEAGDAACKRIVPLADKRAAERTTSSLA